LPNETYADLVVELGNASSEGIDSWLRTALAGGESRLPISRGEPLEIGLFRLGERLDTHTRRALSKSAVDIMVLRIQGDVATSVAGVETLLSVIATYSASDSEDTAYPAATTALWKFVLNDDRFDVTPMPVQIAVLNFLEERPELASLDIWRLLVARDSGRFGVTCFAAIARVNYYDALSILPDLPATPEVLTGLRLRLRWLISIVPVEERARWFDRLGNTLRQVPAALRTTIQVGLADCGVDITVLIPIRFGAVLRILDKPAAPRDALSPLGLEELFN